MPTSLLGPLTAHSSPLTSYFLLPTVAHAAGVIPPLGGVPPVVGWVPLGDIVPIGVVVPPVAGFVSGLGMAPTLLALCQAANNSSWLAKRIRTRPFITWTSWTTSSAMVTSSALAPTC